MLSEKDTGMIRFDGKTLDFTQVLQEQIIMALPVKALCKKDCRGLCPRCGADLNAGPCACGAETHSSPFAALKKLDLSDR